MTNPIKITDNNTRASSPFSCSRCGTDFTQSWKSKRPGLSEVVCEACVLDSQRYAIHKTYNNVISGALKQHSISEREIEQEYQDVVNSSAKLDAFIKEHERKLLVNHQTQLAQQQQQQQQQQHQAATVNNLHNQRYHSQQGFQNQVIWSINFKINNNDCHYCISNYYEMHFRSRRVGFRYLDYIIFFQLKFSFVLFLLLEINISDQSNRHCLNVFGFFYIN